MWANDCEAFVDVVADWDDFDMSLSVVVVVVVLVVVVMALMEGGVNAGWNEEVN